MKIFQLENKHLFFLKREKKGILMRYILGVKWDKFWINPTVQA